MYHRDLTEFRSVATRTGGTWFASRLSDACSRFDRLLKPSGMEFPCQPRTSWRPRSRDPAALLLFLTFAPARCPYRCSSIKNYALLLTYTPQEVPVYLLGLAHLPYGIVAVVTSFRSVIGLDLIRIDICYDSAPGLQGRRRYINIRRAQWGTTPHAGSGGVETPTTKVRGPARTPCPLSSPALALRITRAQCHPHATWRPLPLLLLVPMPSS